MRLGLLIVASLAMAPAMAVAQSSVDTRNFTVIGNVPGGCALGTPEVAAGEQINFRGINGNTLQIAELVDPYTLSTKAASVQVSFDAVCNFPHTLSLESQNNGLFQTFEFSQDPAEGFGDGVPYTANVDWSDENLILLADARERRVAESRIFIDSTSAGELILRLDIGSGATNLRNFSPLLAGIYGDTIRITLEPRT